MTLVGGLTSYPQNTDIERTLHDELGNSTLSRNTVYTLGLIGAAVLLCIVAFIGLSVTSSTDESINQYLGLYQSNIHTQTKQLAEKQLRRDQSFTCQPGSLYIRGRCLRCPQHIRLLGRHCLSNDHINATKN